MEHHHHSTTMSDSSQLNRAFLIGIVLNLAYVVLQIVVGLNINSLSLLSDAGHNFLDVSGLALSLLAFRLIKTKPSNRFTYGYKKSSILISLLNTIILLISIGAIGYESITRFQHPEHLPGKVVAIIALIGIVINGFSAFLFFRGIDQDINIRSAFLHLFSDALISVGLVIGGILIYYTDMYWIDPLLSLLICMVIIWSTWSLLKRSLHLSLDGVPEEMDVQKIIQIVHSVKGVVNLHHVHVWAISTKEIALTGHLVVSGGEQPAMINRIRREVKHQLKLLNVSHSTLEVELGGECCEEENC